MAKYNPIQDQVEDAAEEIAERKARHTPGPWRHNGAGHSMACAVWAYATVDSALGPEPAVFICSTYATQPRFADAPLDEKDANARLIAAATELLEACELAEGWIDANREDATTGEGQQAKWILDTLRAAIAKATA